MLARRIPAMGYSWHPNVHACATGGSIVLLDVKEDRYLALGPASSKTVIDLCHGAALTPDRLREIAVLTDSGLLRETAFAGTPLLTPARAPAEGDIADADSASVLGALGATAAIARATFALRLRSLAKVLQDLRSTIEQRPLGDPQSVAHAFARADRWFSAQDRCLPRALALTRILRGRGFAVALVVGVKLRPFEAHSWVEFEGRVFGDRLGTISKFSPILVA